MKSITTAVVLVLLGFFFGCAADTGQTPALSAPPCRIRFFRFGGTAHAMKLLVHSIFCGLGIEAALIGIWLVFPISLCDAPLPARGVLYVHRPAFHFSEHILGLVSWKEQLVIAPILMVMVWVSLFAVLGYLLRLSDRHRD